MRLESGRLLAAAVLAASVIGCSGGEPLPELVPIGEFALVDQDGRPFGNDDLRGKVWIVDFVFTSCRNACPVLTTQMANLHRRIDSPDVRFVSVSVDPATDTPERLREYAARFRADTSRWTFLTGDPATVRLTIERAFRQPVGERTELGEGGYDILHANRFMLVDRRGMLRGLYETDAEGLERLERDALRLVAEGG
ncbi:MAG TPA: SCO family protein [Sandaracinaceae bacterium]